LFEAAARFSQYRLPEVFAGFSREKYSIPVRYPVACRPQAWAAGALPHMLATSLGLIPDAINRRLEVCRPMLPDWLREVTLRGLRVGDASIDLRYRRTGDETLVGLVARRGDVELVVTY
jgi:glycogen debranching enzyme